jgi:hypothetical protein
MQKITDKALKEAAKKKQAWRGGALLWPEEPCSTSKDKARLAARARAYFKYAEMPLPENWKRAGRPRQWEN